MIKIKLNNLILNKKSNHIAKILLSAIFVLILFFVNKNSYAAYIAPGEITDNLKNVPSVNKKEMITDLEKRVNNIKKKHPNWKIMYLYTGMDWNQFIDKEYSPEKSSPYCLISDSKEGEWICEIRGKKRYDNGSWFAASKKTIAFYADPRTYLNTADIFALKSSSRNYTKDSEKKIKECIKKYIQGTTYSNRTNDIYEASKKKNFDVVDLLSTLRQEQGNGGSVLVDGFEENGKTYYNPLNIGASGNLKANVIKSGKRKAVREGWDSFEKGLIGGISLIQDVYEKQTTIYLRKFDCFSLDFKFVQYMQNIEDPMSQSEMKKALYQSFDKNLEEQYTFLIPIFKNMPVKASPMPSSVVHPKLENIDDEDNAKYPLKGIMNDAVFLKKEPKLNTARLGLIGTGAKIEVLEKCKNNPVDGYIWFKVKAIGKIGYMARRPEKSSTQYFSLYKEKEITPSNPGSGNDQENIKFPAKGKVTDNDGIRMRENPGLDFKQIAHVEYQDEFRVLGKTPAPVNGYIWYKIEYKNKTGYIARNRVGSTTYYFDINQEKENETGEEIKKLTMIDKYSALDEKNEAIYITPSLNKDKFKKLNKGMVIYDKKGKKTETLMTGGKVEYGGKKYTIVLKGDVNQDGDVDLLDLYKVLSFLHRREKLDIYQLTATYEKIGYTINDTKKSDKEPDLRQLYGVLAAIKENSANTLKGEI